MHPESKVFIRGQQGQMREATGDHAGFTHTRKKAKDIGDSADFVGYSIYDGPNNIEGFNLSTQKDSRRFHLSSKDWPVGIRHSIRGYEKIAEAVEERTGKAPVTVVIS